MLTAGAEFTCGVSATTSPGASYCWGANVNDELGLGFVRNRATPFGVLGNHQFAALGVGYLFSCALDVSGAAYCWGSNGTGALGDNTFTDSFVPVAVQGGHLFDVLTTGGYWGCGLLQGSGDRDAYCWGWDLEGELGDNNPGTYSPIPVAVTGAVHSFTGISSGLFHSCAVTTAGTAYCWGQNASGELGDGTTTDGHEPVAVSGSVTFDAVAAGYQYSCGIERSTQHVYCWGDNTFGELGDATNDPHPSPTEVAGGRHFTAVVAGSYHTCALEAGTGDAYCWGTGFYGALGTGTSVELVPTIVSGSVTSFSFLTAGGYSTCAITGSGDTYCWGASSGLSLPSSDVPLFVAAP
jgi:alpha-tubulin suppressor-like RCC1 family protein